MIDKEFFLTKNNGIYTEQNKKDVGEFIKLNKIFINKEKSIEFLIEPGIKMVFDIIVSPMLSIIKISNKIYEINFNNMQNIQKDFTMAKKSLEEFKSIYYRKLRGSI